LTWKFSRYTLGAMGKQCCHRGRISYAVLRLAGKLEEVRRKTHNFGTDVRLFEAEVHMIKAVKENEGLHATRLAEKLNVTKGAVSQIIGKLQKKGMILKIRDECNQSRLKFVLTSKGERAYEFHEAIHREFDAVIDQILCGASPEQMFFLQTFLESLEKKIESYL